MGRSRRQRKQLRNQQPAPQAKALQPIARDIPATQPIGQQVGAAAPLARDWFSYPFGPGTPIVPAPIDPVRGDTGRAEPRQWAYPVSWNLPGNDSRGNRCVPWQVLREAADNIALLRDCIRIRKNEILALDWTVAVSKRAIQAEQRRAPDDKRTDIERKMRDRLAPEIERCEAFWSRPDPRNGLSFAKWASKVLEEHLVLDALAIYPRYTYGGDLAGLEVIDGSTIKPLLDHYGGRPVPPEPAYQQILYGFPRGEYHATVSTPVGSAGLDGAAVDAAYLADQLIYEVREVRTTTPYGFSAVEQSLYDADLWMKRMSWLRAEYTDGVMPAGWMLNEESTWTPEQLKAFETEFNDFYSGMTQQRQRFRVLPPGIKPDHSGRDLGERYRPEYDLHLLKLMCAHFDLTIAELGFTEAKGLGSAGYHEGQENVQERKGTRPDLKWFESVLTGISVDHLRMPPELEFRWLGLDEEDQTAADDLNRTRFSSAGITLNEWRDEQGMAPYTFAEADMPMLVTQRGVVFLEGASELAPAGELISPAQAPPLQGQGEGGNQEEQDDQGDQEADTPKPVAKTGDKAAELAAYRRYAAKGNRSRQFRWEHHSAEEIALLVKAGGVDPKASVRRDWPGWTVDLQAAALWAGRIGEELTSAVDLRRLAERWLTSRPSAAKAAPTGPGAHDAAGWLDAEGVTVTAALRGVLHDVWTDGYVLGDRAALALTVDADVDWSGWTPGDSDAALEALGADGLGEGLQALLDQADVEITSIATNRMIELAEVLAGAAERGSSVDELEAALRDVLDNPAWSRMIAVTELNRAISAATLSRYATAGIEAAYWMTAMDERVCSDCGGNEDAGAVLLNQPFPNGSYQPPAHPLCRCALAPVIADLSEVDTTGLAPADLEAS